MRGLTDSTDMQISSLLACSWRCLINNRESVRRALPGSLLAACVALAFLTFFQFTKHDPTLSGIMPFGNDPYDAVGSFGVISAALLSLLSIARALQAFTPRRQVLAARTQAAIAAALLVTLLADIVAMGRHVPLWLGQPAAWELLALLVAMLALALLLWFVARSSVRHCRLPTARWRRATIVCTVAVALLALYPESIADSTVGELFTIVAGILLLFIPMSAVLEVFVPWDGASAQRAELLLPRLPPTLQWIAIALLGVGIGIALLAREWLGDTPAPQLRLLVASVYVGGALVGLSIAYYFLRRPLALFRY